MHLPTPLAADGFVLRPQCGADYDFLERLYMSVRKTELAPLDWPDVAKRAFLADQHRLQHAHYSQHYRDAEFLILEHLSEPVGRLVVYCNERDLRIVDIALLPECRNRGVGTALLQAAMNEAAAAGKTVSIHVEKFNPAQRLYRRLDFHEISESGPYWLMEWRREERPPAA